MQTDDKKWYKKRGNWLLLLALLFLSLIFAFFFYLYGLINTEEWQRSQITQVKPTIDEAAIEKITKDSYWMGTSSPKVTIIEFGDFSCSSCKKSFYTIREIGLKYKDDVKIVFKDYPIISENSPTLASAARCAGEQGQGFFWSMYDKLFTYQGVTDKQKIVELAKRAGVNISRFNACFDNNKYQAKIGQDYQDGNSLQINGTPTWFINGIKIEGNIPYDYFVQIIESLINKQ